MCRARAPCSVAKRKTPNKDVVNFECALYGMENVVASVAISSNSDDTEHVANKIVIFILGTNAKDDDGLHVTAERDASGLAILPSGHYAQCVCVCANVCAGALLNRRLSHWTSPPLAIAR